MNKKIFDTYEELVAELEPLLHAGKIRADIKELENGKFEAQWRDMLKYRAHDGKECDDEVWITEKEELLFIQELSEEHVRNILRMLLRNDRAARLRRVQLQSQIADIIDNVLLDESDDETQDTDILSHRPNTGGFLH